MKKFLLALMTAVSALCLSFGFAACGEEGKKPDENQQQTEQTPSEQKPGESQEQQTPSEKPGENQQDPNEEQENTSAPVYLGMSIQSSAPQTIMPMTIFPSRSIWAQGDEIYQSRTDTDILINIHFENPEQYEILSFTLNKKKFASNMFERESDLENIILKVSVGDFDEVTEYTIDAIKYIDGEMIKDVKIGGDQTVKLYREYAITYHDTFEAEYPTQYTILSDTISFEALSRTGYTFEGWFEDEAYTKKIESIEKGSKGDRDIYAKWEIVNYNIEYILDGGENPEENPKTYTVEDKIEFIRAKKEGNVFIGWYKDEEHKELVQMLENTTGDLKLYALWTEGTEGLEFSKVEGGYAVCGYHGESTKVIIPDKCFGGESVTEIANWAFTECKIVESVDLPDSVSLIGYEAFKDCENLSSIKISENLKEIGIYSFRNCRTLKSFIIPNSVSTIESGAFDGCSSLESVTIGKGIIAIKESAFVDCTGLKKVEIHDISSWLNIEFFDNPLFYAHHLFLDGVEIVELKIPDGVTKIASKAFLECEGIKNVIIPRGVLNIGDSAFEGCGALENVTIADTVTTIEIQAFSNCSALKSLELPESIMEIGERAFEGSALEEIVIPDGVSEIKEGTFFFCENLKKVMIPNRVIKIGNTAFCYCYALESVVIPDSVTTICGGAFEYTGLKSVVLGKGITKIEDFIFGWCGQLTEISYNGSKEEWEKIELDSKWNESSNIVKIICKEGNQEIEVVDGSI